MTTFLTVAVDALTVAGVLMAAWGAWHIGVELRGWVERQREYRYIKRRLDLIAAMERRPSNPSGDLKWPR